MDVAMNVKDQLVRHGTVTRGRLGVAIQDVNQALADSFGLKQPAGALVSSVEKDSPAAGPRQDEVIFARNGDTYVLREVWDASTASGAQAIEPHAAHARHDGKAR